VLALENRVRAVRDIATTVGVEFQGAGVRFKFVGLVLFQPVNWAKSISYSCLGKYLALNQGPTSRALAHQNQSSV